MSAGIMLHSVFSGSSEIPSCSWCLVRPHEAGQDDEPSSHTAAHQRGPFSTAASPVAACRDRASQAHHEAPGSGELEAISVRASVCGRGKSLLSEWEGQSTSPSSSKFDTAWDPRHRRGVPERMGLSLVLFAHSFSCFMAENSTVHDSGRCWDDPVCPSVTMNEDP